MNACHQPELTDRKHGGMIIEIIRAGCFSIDLLT